MALSNRHLLLLLWLAMEGWAAQSKNPLFSILYPPDIFSNSRGVFKVVQQECVSNPSFLTLICEYTRNVNTSGSIVLLANYIRSISAVGGELKLLSKSPTAKFYKSTVVRQKVDYCMMSVNQNSPNLLLMFMPPDFEKILPMCPLFGKYEFNFTLPMVPVDMKLFPKTDYRLDIVFTTDNQVLVWRSLSYLKIVAI